MSKKIVLNAAGDAATITDAKIGDVFTTLLSTEETVTGAYGLLQKVGLVGVGMMTNSYRLRGSFNPFVR